MVDCASGDHEHPIACFFVLGVRTLDKSSYLYKGIRDAISGTTLLRNVPS
jgi:hypothetical protein